MAPGEGGGGGAPGGGGGGGGGGLSRPGSAGAASTASTTKSMTSMAAGMASVPPPPVGPLTVRHVAAGGGRPLSASQASANKAAASKQALIRRPSTPLVHLSVHGEAPAGPSGDGTPPPPPPPLRGGPSSKDYGHEHGVLLAVDVSLAAASTAAPLAQLERTRGGFRPDGTRTTAGPTPGEEELLLKRPGSAAGGDATRAIRKSVSASGLLRHE